MPHFLSNNRLVQRIIHRLTNVSNLRFVLTFVTLALIISVMIVLTIDFLWDGRFNPELEFAGVITPFLDALLLAFLFTAVFDALREEIKRRKLAEEVKAASELKLRALFDTVNDSIFIVDHSGLIMDVNNIACERLGYRRADLLKMTPRYFDTSEYAAKVTERFAEIRRQGSAIFETAWVTHDGRIIPVEISARAIEYEGKPAILSVARDITQRKQSEEALKSLTLRHTAILAAVPDIIMEVDNNKIYVWANEAGYAFFGDDVIGREAAYYFEGEQTTYNAVQPLFAGNDELLHVESWQRRKDGEKRLLAWRCRVLRDSEGNVRGAVSTARDITDWKRMEEVLQQSEKRFRDLVETGSDWVWEVDANARYTYASPHIRALLGYEPEQVLGKTPFDLMTEDEAQRVAAVFGPIAAKREPVSALENVNRHKDGRLVVFETNGVPFFDADGTFQGYRGVDRDITERKKAEEALQKSEQFNRRILETVDEGFIVIDPEYKIISANKAYLNMINRTEEDVKGEHCYKLSHRLCKPCCEAGENCAVSVTLKTGTPQTATHTHYDETGHAVFVELKSFPVKDAAGKVVAAIEVINNITERKKLEDQLRHAQKMEAIGTLAGGVAHDFNNILNVIIGYGTMALERQGDDELSKEQINEVLAAADRAATLTKRLLTFSRKQAVEMAPVNVHELIIGLEKMITRIIGEDIVFTLELVGSDMLVMADSGQVEQVLMNLVSNARDAMPKGGKLMISTESLELDDAYISAHGYGKAGDYVRIAVTDTGSGMDAETQKNIFEPFFTTKGVGKGTGLGLAIAYGIIKQHNGYINVYSELGQGASFKIYLPLLEEGALKAQVVESVAPIKGGTETILLAEDEPSLRKLMKIVLESSGYSVIAAEDGEDAITRYIENQDKIQMVILDMIMPKKSGKEAYEEIRKLTPDIKTLFVSGYTMDIIHRKELLDEGMDFILKPVSPKDLVKKVREILDS